VPAAKPTLFLQSRYPEVQHCASDDFIDRQQRWRDCSANDVGHRLPPIRRNAFAGYWRLPEPDLREGELGHKDKHSHLGAICDVAHIPIRWRRCNPRQPGTRTGRNPASVFSPGAMHQTKCGGCHETTFETPIRHPDPHPRAVDRSRKRTGQTRLHGGGLPANVGGWLL